MYRMYREPSPKERARFSVGWRLDPRRIGPGLLRWRDRVGRDRRFSSQIEPGRAVVRTPTGGCGALVGDVPIAVHGVMSPGARSSLAETPQTGLDFLGKPPITW